MSNYKSDNERIKKKTTRNIILIIVGVVGLSILAAFLVYFMFFTDEEEGTDEPGSLDNSNQTSEPREEEPEPEEDTEVEMPEPEPEEEPEEEYPEIVEDVLSQIERLHEFSSPDEDLYDSVVNELAQMNVEFELSEEEQAPFVYGLNENSGEILVITAGVMINSGVLESENGFTIEVESRMANSPTENSDGELMDADEVGDNLQEHLREDDHSDLTETTVYQLNETDNGYELIRE